jgi:hypothetical protein
MVGLIVLEATLGIDKHSLIYKPLEGLCRHESLISKAGLTSKVLVSKVGLTSKALICWVGLGL